MPLRIFKNSGRASAAGGGMAVEASKRPTTNIVPRRMTALRSIGRPRDGGSDDITAPGNPRFPPSPIRVQIQRLKRSRFGRPGHIG